MKNHITERCGSTAEKDQRCQQLVKLMWLPTMITSSQNFIHADKSWPWGFVQKKYIFQMFLRTSIYLSYFFVIVNKKLINGKSLLNLCYVPFFYLKNKTVMKTKCFSENFKWVRVQVTYFKASFWINTY